MGYEDGWTKIDRTWMPPRVDLGVQERFVNLETRASNLEARATTLESGLTTAEANITAGPIGLIGYSQATTNQTLIGGGETDLTDLTVTLTMPAGRQVKITVALIFQRTVADGRTNIIIYEDASQIQFGNVQPVFANQSISLEKTITRAPTAGSHTWKVIAYTASGTGTSTLAAAVNFPALLYVEDLGAQ